MVWGSIVKGTASFNLCLRIRRRIPSERVYLSVIRKAKNGYPMGFGCDGCGGCPGDRDGGRGRGTVVGDCGDRSGGPRSDCGGGGGVLSQARAKTQTQRQTQTQEQLLVWVWLWVEVWVWVIAGEWAWLWEMERACDRIHSNVGLCAFVGRQVLPGKPWTVSRTGI